MSRLSLFATSLSSYSFFYSFFWVDEICPVYSVSNGFVGAGVVVSIITAGYLFYAISTECFSADYGGCELEELVLS